ncbi:NUDIX hydrolase [Cyclobacteriaceae bacterium]|nr:NUDIX hydrolase [Cyclobacteriaceae bacterium]
MKKNGPWTIKSSKTVYKNPWIEVNEDEVLQPNGQPGIFGTVHMVPGISVLPIDEQMNVYLTKEFRYVIGKDSLEIVSGGIDVDEPPLDAAHRELKEELGISATKITDLGVCNPFTSAIHSPAHLFLAQGLSFGESNQDGTEIIEMIKMPFDKAVELAMSGEIHHAPSCLAILKAARLLQLKG